MSAARNLGMEHASGKYIGFVDADDMVAPNMFKALVQCMGPGIEMTACRFRRCKREELDVTETSVTHPVITNQTETAERILNGGYGPNVWNKLYRKSILDQNNIAFRVDCGIAEDQYFTMEYLQHCTKAAFIDAKLYYYITNETSLMNSFRINRFVSGKYKSLPRSWAYTANVVREISEDLTVYAQARAAMFYQTVLRKLEKPDSEYIEETSAYVRQNKSVLRRYRWGWKYYLSAVVLCMSYSLWAAIFRRRPGNVRSEEEK